MSATKKPKPIKGNGKVEKVMKEYKEGKLHAGSKKGPIVRSKTQATAIALSEQHKKDITKRKKKKII